MFEFSPNLFESFWQHPATGRVQAVIKGKVYLVTY